MSIQAVAWVLAQSGEDLPGTGRLVMIALANHADHTSGHCWPSMKTIANEAGCGERTASRYLSALKRNGFIDIRQSQRKRGQFRSNDYWIVFDRKPAPWQWFGKNESELEQSVQEDEPYANLADGHDEEESADRTPLLADGPSATVGVRQEVMLEPSESEPSGATTPPTDLAAPIGFEAAARFEEQARLEAAEDARKPKSVFVHQGTRAWLAWQKTRPRGYPCHQFTIEGKLCFGWHFPTLFPPSATGPPEEPTFLTPADDRYIRKQGLG